MSSILDIPYVSQRDRQTAGYSFNDCGPACLAMMILATGQEVTTDGIYRRAEIANQGPLAVSTLKRAGNLYDLDLRRHDKSTDGSLTSLQTWIDEGRPAMVLVDYYPVMQAGYHESTIRGGHFVTVVGYDDNHVYVHDPYWLGNGGAYRQWSVPVFNQAWYQYGTQYQRVALVPRSSLAELQEPPYEVPDGIMRRIRARAYFEGQPLPRIRSEEDYEEILGWLGNWGTEYQRYTVKSGDTLGEISEHFFGSAQFYLSIAALSGIDNPNRLDVGIELRIPVPPEKESIAKPKERELSFTNQQLINAFYYVYRARRKIDEYWDVLVDAGLGHIVNERSARYEGPPVKDLPNVPEDIKEAVLEELTKD